MSRTGIDGREVFRKTAYQVFREDILDDFSKFCGFLRKMARFGAVRARGARGALPAARAPLPTSPAATEPAAVLRKRQQRALGRKTAPKSASFLLLRWCRQAAKAT